MIKASEELSKLNRTLNQIAEYNESMKKDIGVTRRTTYRAEENIQNLEKEKKKQDFLIDHLSEQLKKLKEEENKKYSMILQESLKKDELIKKLKAQLKSQEKALKANGTMFLLRVISSWTWAYEKQYFLKFQCN